jgi:hypothetical protein
VLPEKHKDLQDIMPLTPDYHTFKAMMAYHTNVSGDLDRITVLLREMTELFGIPMRTLNFQLLFKGFALHGKMKDREALWSAHRLEMVWDVCRNSIKKAQKVASGTKLGRQDPSLPSARAAEALPFESLSALPAPKAKRSESWKTFLADLSGSTPQPGSHILMVRGDQFDDIADEKPSTPLQDVEEGEYVLPSPAETIHPGGLGQDQTGKRRSVVPAEEADMDEEHDPDSTQIQATRLMICWLLRAYTRCTGSRSRVERIWNSVRLLWNPKTEADRQSVLRVLRRCLKDCDESARWTL